jgi:hypothetical protein
VAAGAPGLRGAGCQRPAACQRRPRRPGAAPTARPSRPREAICDSIAAALLRGVLPGYRDRRDRGARLLRQHGAGRSPGGFGGLADSRGGGRGRAGQLRGERAGEQKRPAQGAGGAGTAGPKADRRWRSPQPQASIAQQRAFQADPTQKPGGSRRVGLQPCSVHTQAHLSQRLATLPQTKSPTGPYTATGPQGLLRRRNSRGRRPPPRRGRHACNEPRVSHRHTYLMRCVGGDDTTAQRMQRCCMPDASQFYALHASPCFLPPPPPSLIPASCSPGRAAGAARWPRQHAAAGAPAPLPAC